MFQIVNSFRKDVVFHIFKDSLRVAKQREHVANAYEMFLGIFREYDDVFRVDKSKLLLNSL